MPKKSVAARSGAQRQKPRAQKSFELVRPETEEQEREEQIEAVPVAPSAAIETTAPKRQENRPTTRVGTTPSPAVVIPEPEVATKDDPITPSKASASSRMAARRQATQRAQQRSSTILISAEHFAYVRRELVIIATLAILMFIAIIVLYFVFGRGA